VISLPGIRVAPEVAPLLRAAIVQAEPVQVGPAGNDLVAEIGDACSALRSEHAGRAPSGIPGLGPARELYRAFRIDPTRTRPSSEALVRRVLQDRPFPRILNAVDLCNLLSIRLLLPLGLYDAGRIRGSVTLRRGLPGESYPGIRKEEVHLEGRPVLADETGPFGNPTSDSLRTSVTPATRGIWLVIFAPASLPAESLRRHAGAAREAMARHLAPRGAAAATRVDLLP
jgi:DNA/RNA-binding domain of Phe-tRNA-synthetase-like protein